MDLGLDHLYDPGRVFFFFFPFFLNRCSGGVSSDSISDWDLEAVDLPDLWTSSMQDVVVATAVWSVYDLLLRSITCTRWRLFLFVSLKLIKSLYLPLILELITLGIVTSCPPKALHYYSLSGSSSVADSGSRLWRCGAQSHGRPGSVPGGS